VQKTEGSIAKIRRLSDSSSGRKKPAVPGPNGLLTFVLQFYDDPMHLEAPLGHE
jgi:hypothetical protein